MIAVDDPAHVVHHLLAVEHCAIHLPSSLQSLVLVSGARGRLVGRHLLRMRRSCRFAVRAASQNQRAGQQKQSQSTHHNFSPSYFGSTTHRPILPSSRQPASSRASFCAVNEHVRSTSIREERNPDHHIPGCPQAVSYPRAWPCGGSEARFADSTKRSRGPQPDPGRGKDAALGEHKMLSSFAPPPRRCRMTLYQGLRRREGDEITVQR